MAIENIQRERLLSRAMLARPGAEVAVTIVLWQRLADELIQIIGENGFDSLFLRSLHQVGRRYPALTVPLRVAADTPRFADFESRLRQCSTGDAGAASVLLFVAFLDTLNLLIGEPLTTSLLRSAWGDDVFDQAGPESQNT